MFLSFCTARFYYYWLHVFNSALCSRHMFPYPWRDITQYWVGALLEEDGLLKPRLIANIKEGQQRLYASIKMGIFDQSSHLEKSRFIIHWPVRCRQNSPNERVVDRNSEWPSVYSHLNRRKCKVWQSHSVASIDCGLQVCVPQVCANFWKISNSLQA